MNYCPDCGAKVSEEQNYCEQCGAELLPQSKFKEQIAEQKTEPVSQKKGGLFDISRNYYVIKERY